MVGSRHDKVKQSIDRLIEREIIAKPPLGNVPYVDESGRNRMVEAYIFEGEKGKRDSIVVVAQLSPEFTAALVDRWAELEQQVRTMTPDQMYQALWKRHRLQAATQYTRMTEAYKAKLRRENPYIKESALGRACAEEAEFINKITHGLLSGMFRSGFNVGDEGIREHMPDRLLEAITVVEQQNFSLLMADVPRQQRWDIIDKYLSSSYPEIVAFRNRQEARLAEIRQMTDGEKHLPLHPKEDPNLSSYSYIDSLRNLTPRLH